MNKTPPSNRLTGFLLIVSSVSLTVAVLCGSYLYFNASRIRSLKAELLSARAVQERLFEGQRMDHALYPHRRGRVGYVLNPHMREATLWGLADKPYPVNALGLRGAPVQHKKPGVQRILLVGDSWFFGWLLEEKDKLERQLGELLSSRLKQPEFEVITVAVPGWNVLSQSAFLENHWNILDADFVVWAMCTNDAEDVGGVSPPGVLGYFLSPQNYESTPFTKMNGYTTYPMPFVIKRHRQNLRLVEAFQREHQIGVLLLIVDIRPAFLDIVSEGKPLGVPVLPLPFGAYADDERRLVSVSPYDGHPSAWFNGIMALGLAEKMSEMKVIPELHYTEEELDVLDNFGKENRYPVTAADVERYIRDYVSATLEEYGAGSEDRRLPGFGIAEDGKLSEHGVLYLKVKESVATITIDLDVWMQQRILPNTLSIVARDFEGHERRVEKTIRETSVSVDIDLPEPRSRYPLVELEWRFGRSSCQTPYTCDSALLVRMYSH